ncbi:PPE family protein [Mycobacterium riyadhense]|uniref:PPE family protein n=1 Tax=Mycobacterium riyadhense TaxID=486698 RepID=UPI0019514E94|nr:PPE family protein [Mycobacterium riyadhense]
MDYGLLAPEINSGRMYAGPGAGSFLEAAEAWGGLAADLHSTAVSYQSVISTLTSGPWLGPTSVALVAAVTPYVAWLQSTAAHAELAASQAAAAAAAHATAFAMTVPPPLIAANRARLTALVATNFLGQNASAIAATEALYAEMWAQDATAMYGYAVASAAAAELTDFEEPADIADHAGLARQAAALGITAARSTETGVRDALSNLTTAVPGALRKLAAPVANSIVDDLIELYTKYLAPFAPTLTSLANSTSAVTAVTSFMKGLAPVAQAVQGEVAALASGVGSALTGGLGAAGFGAAGAGSAASTVSASLGRSVPLGALSVPASWTAVAPVTSPVAAAMGTSAIAAAPTEPVLHGLPMAPLGGMVGQFGGRTVPQYGFRPLVMSRPPAAG